MQKPILPPDAECPSRSANQITVQRWQDSLQRRVVARITYPLFWLLNRPSGAWFGRAAYDFALRCNGMAINFKGHDGLNIAEEKFLAGLAPSLAGGVVLDVGANVGAYSCALSRLAPTATIHAFEAHPRTIEILRQRVAGTRIVALHLALGEKEGQLQLFDFAAADGSTQASLSRNAIGLYDDQIVAHDVPCSTVDAFMESHGITQVDFLKIDTEGFDLNVLRGARRALAERRIKAIQFEFIAANIATGVRMRDFFDVLAGYHIHRLCLNGGLLSLHPYDVKRTEIYVNQNLIAIPIH